MNLWRTVNPLFGNKIKCKSQISLVEGNNLATNGKALAKMFNAFFVNGAATLGIKYEKLPINYEDSNYNPDELIIRYNDHPSIITIKNKCTELNSTFTSEKVAKEQISTAIKRLDSKNFQSQMTYHSELSRNLVTFPKFSLPNIAKNEFLDKGFFPGEIKCTEVVPVYEKNDKKDKNNYRPASVLSNISKLYENCMLQQINEYLESLLSKLLCGSRQGFSAQRCLLVMVKKIKEEN